MVRGNKKVSCKHQALGARSLSSWSMVQWTSLVIGVLKLLSHETKDRPTGRQPRWDLVPGA